MDFFAVRPQGFDEYMNVVLDDAEELSIKKKSRKPLGRILLKGDNITLMMNACAHPAVALVDLSSAS